VHEEVFCTKKRGHMLRTKRCAFLSWPNGSTELYDMDKDPKQFTNLAADPKHAAAKSDLQRRLKAKLAAISEG
jgi:iduronate 2-sulfatase